MHRGALSSRLGDDWLGDDWLGDDWLGSDPRLLVDADGGVRLG